MCSGRRGIHDGSTCCSDLDGRRAVVHVADTDLDGDANLVADDDAIAVDVLDVVTPLVIERLREFRHRRGC